MVVISKRSKSIVNTYTQPLTSLARFIAEGNLSQQPDPVIHSYEETDKVLTDFIEQAKSLEAKRLVEAKLESLEMFAQMTAHDVRQPLEWMRSELKQLSELPGVEPSTRIELKRFLNTFEKKVSLTDEILQDILDLRRNNLSRHEELSLGRLIQQVLNELEVIFNGRELSFLLKNHLDSFAIGDVKKIRRVLTNLIKNAIEASEDGEQIEIAVGDSDGNSVIRISNSAVIPEAILRDIFEPFVTLGKPRGSGLGLAICKKFVEASNGAISVRSSAENGTCFEISLPKGSQKETHDLPTSIQWMRDAFITLKDGPTAPLAVIDDDPFIVDYYKNRFPDIDFDYYSSPEELICIGADTVNLYTSIYTDFYFQSSSKFNGLTFAKFLRDKFGYPGEVILLSDANLDADSTAFFEKVLLKG